jgi:enoyl-CoA hydratase/carnithine racemase
VSGQIHLRRDGAIAELVLDNSTKRNAISQAMWQALPGLIAEIEAEAEIKVVIIHGGHAGAFAAGADISEFEVVYATSEAAKTSSDHIGAALSAIEHCSKPVLAAIDGACVGGGVSIAMACDIRIAGEGAKFGVTPGKLGLCYPVADTRRLVQQIGPAATKEILFTGAIFTAQRAAEIGLINHRVAGGEALAHARAMAAEIAATSQWSARASKTMVNALASGAAVDAADLEALYLSGFEESDFQEGFRAFLDKRKPDFRWR